MTSVWVYGISGRMGQALVKCLDADDSFYCHGGSNAAGDVDPDGKSSVFDAQVPDVFIDFSTVAGNDGLLQRLLAASVQGKAVLIATTGLDRDRISAWQQAAESLQLRLLFAPNTSVGIAVLLKTALTAQKLLGAEFDIEIVETHNRYKRDAPSGTAHYVAAQLAETGAAQLAETGAAQLADTSYHIQSGRNGLRKAKEIGLHAVRGGDVIGEHTVSFFGMDEELHITHRARDRRLFAKGALTLVSWLQAKDAGSYQLADM